MYLLDTNALIAVLFQPEKLTASTASLMTRERCLWTSIVSLWEIAIKQSIGKLQLLANPEEIAECCGTLGIEILPVMTDHIS